VRTTATIPAAATDMVEADDGVVVFEAFVVVVVVVVDVVEWTKRRPSY